MSSLQAIIFDLDGVLVYSAERHWQAYRQAFLEAGVDFPLELYLRVGVGAPRERVVGAVLGAGASAATVASVMARKEELITQTIRAHGLPPVPGAKAFVDRARGLGLRVAVATASRTPRLLLEGGGYGDVFELVISRSEVARAKPDPEIYLESARRLGLPPKACLVIEDSPTGIEAGLAAGMGVVAISTTHPPEALAKAHRVVETFSEIALPEWGAETR